MAHGYHLVMVSPWRRIDLLEPLDPQVAAEIDRAAEMIPAACDATTSAGSVDSVR